MASLVINPDSIKKIHWNYLGAPLGALILLTIVLLPLPPFILDILFTFNIALSLLIALMVFNLLRPLDFSSFPSVILMATLLRLALNIASTRIVLLHGHTGVDAAGKVIETFGEFIIGGNYVVGLILFAIFTVINFVVITKGTTRVSEVIARFTLDALPGKQMAIDADLTAGVINKEQAKERRREIREESDFYGSMDGASKFIRGDAIAGILILFINLVGGLVLGIFQHHMTVEAALKSYTLLTIGDGLVAQVPALILSVAAAIMVTRVSHPQKIGAQVVTQAFAHPHILAVVGGSLGIMGLIPGMPNVAFLIMGIACGALAYLLSQRTGVTRPTEGTTTSLPIPIESGEVGWEDVQPADIMGLEVGYRLIPLVNPEQGGELMPRIKGVRRKLSQELGFLVPPVHIRDNLDLPANVYRITLMGVPVGEGEIYTDRLLAINPGNVRNPVTGISAHDPAFGLEACWIKADAKEQAQTNGYTVVDPGTVIATHLSHITQLHAHELLGHEEVQELLERLAQVAPKLVEDLVPKRMELGVIVKVLQNLLAEKIPLRSIRNIVEVLADHPVESRDPAALTAIVRVALGRQITQEIIGLGGELPVITLAPELEQILLQSLRSSKSSGWAMKPELAGQLQKNVEAIMQRQETMEEPVVLLVASPLRPWLSRLMRPLSSNLHVLAYDEIPDNRRVRFVHNIEK